MFYFFFFLRKSEELLASPDTEDLLFLFRFEFIIRVEIDRDFLQGGRGGFQQVISRYKTTRQLTFHMISASPFFSFATPSSSASQVVSTSIPVQLSTRKFFPLKSFNLGEQDTVSNEPSRSPQFFIRLANANFSK